MAPVTRTVGSSNGSSLVFDDETKRYIADQITDLIGGAMQAVNTRLDNMVNDITGLSLQHNQVGVVNGGCGGLYVTFKDNQD